MFRLSSFRLSPLRIIRARPLRRFAPHLLNRGLWRVTPHTVGMGLAIGLFFGLLIPVGQIFLAVIGAVILRGNLLVAASSTLVSNPLTFPPIYYLAWQIGGLLRTLLPTPLADEAAHLASQAHLIPEGVGRGLGAAGGDLLMGLVCLACLAALTGYLLGWCAIKLGQRWRAARHPDNEKA